MSTTQMSVDFIRLCFPSACEERVAVHWAQLLASIIGDRVMMLRPLTTWSEIFEWVESSHEEADQLVSALADVFALDADRSVDDLEQMSFREFVEYATR